MASTQKIQLKRSSTPSSAPVTGDLDFGELAINTADGIIYFKFANGTDIGKFEYRQNNYGASTAPGSTDDDAAGYVVGSRWLNTSTDREYVLADSTTSSAIWKETSEALTVTNHVGSTSNPHTVTKAQVNLGNVADLKVNLVASTDPGTGDDSGSGYAVGSRWINTTSDEEFVCLDSTGAAAVWESTTSDSAAVTTHLSDTNNPHSVTKTQVSLGNVEDLKVNLVASADPTADDDSGSGYAVGSRWLNTTSDEEFVCLDSASTSAVWLSTTSDSAAVTTHLSDTNDPHSVTKTQVSLGNVEDLKVNLVASTDPGTGDDSGSGYAVGSRWINTTSDEEFVCLDSTGAAAVWITTTGDSSGLATHLSDTGNPHSVTKSQVSLSNVEDLKVNLIATSDPGTGDDTGSGYAVGSRWFNVTSDEEFVCLDSTGAAAVWLSTTSTTAIDSHLSDTGNPHSVTKTQVSLGNVEDLKVNLVASTNPTTTDDSGSGYAIGSRWINTSTTNEYVLLDATVSAAVWVSTTADPANLTNHISNTSNPHTVTKAQVGLTNVADLKVNLVASTDPGTGDDSGSGYAVGSRWINTTSDEEFVCLDSTGAAAVWESTTSTTAVDDHIADTGNPHSVTKTQVSLGNVEDLKVNLVATSDPTATDDTGSGYEVGSRWLNVTSDEEFVCLDSTSTLAVWLTTTGDNANLASHLTNTSNPHTVTKAQVGLSNVENLKVNLAASTDPTINDDDTGPGYAVGSRWINTTTDEEFVCLDASDGAAVWESTTSDSAAVTTHLSDTNDPHSVTKTQVSLGNVEDLKVNLIATVDPTTTDHASSGYAVGSRWFNVTADKEFVCLDPTDSAAVWIETTVIYPAGYAINDTAIATAPTASGDDAISIGDGATASGAKSTAIGFNATASKDNEISFGIGNFGTASDTINGILGLQVTTTTNAVTEMTTGASGFLTIPSDATVMFRAYITARRTDVDDESAAYALEGCIDNNAGTTAIVGAVSKIIYAEDITDWDVTATANNTSDRLQIDVTGENGKTIRWFARVEYTQITG